MNFGNESDIPRDLELSDSMNSGYEYNQNNMMQTMG